MLTEKDILQRIRDGEVGLPPIKLEVAATEQSLSANRQADAVLVACWNGKPLRFIAEIRAAATPRMFQQSVAFVKSLATPPSTYPLIVVPYLSPQRLSELEELQVSGVDLCGNGILTVPGEMFILRSGAENKYRQSSLIKNVYRGETSLVARAFLIQPQYATVKDVLSFIQSRFGQITFSTVSKALKNLEEDLVISREDNSIRLLQPEKLLDQLRNNYESPRQKSDVVGKCSQSISTVLEQLFKMVEERQVDFVIAGDSSADQYAIMAREPIVSLYCSQSPLPLIQAADSDFVVTDRFSNLRIVEVEDRRVFFDRRIKDGVAFASPVQTWLELMAGDKRQQEAADQVKAGILESLASKTTPGGDSL